MLRQIEKIMQSQTTEELRKVLEEVIGYYNVPYFLYGIRIPQVNKQPKDMVINLYLMAGWSTTTKKTTFRWILFCTTA